MNDEQVTAWNGPSGHAWVESQPLLDRILEPMAELLLRAVPEGSARRILDVGCGAGATTLAFARRVGAEGSCLGIDISQPMIDAARARAEREGVPARFVIADAQTHAFEPASFDLIVSRFGVMFFDDPVSAFTNLRRAAKNDAELRFVAWRSPADNPFMTTAERAAAPLLPNLPARRPDGPGQFAFGDAARVRNILEQAGWAAIDIQPVDLVCSFPEKDLVRYLTRMGPLGRVLDDADDATRTRIISSIRAAFDPFVHGDEVRFTSASWQVVAHAPR
ncbi:Methyltransferase [Labilithrix luteola]|uniref:Methyltransferase n=1 Tax=Labilithrix luteola TaxID=1391654 RepID=A0A0K1PM74_9BACT|nr:class I SAM-dependent methyltransferase [Labilithrix luteola]AKU94638.1 Methyltransferase [Labilithrix luteola]